MFEMIENYSTVSDQLHLKL